MSVQIDQYLRYLVLEIETHLQHDPKVHESERHAVAQKELDEWLVEIDDSMC